MEQRITLYRGNPQLVRDSRLDNLESPAFSTSLPVSSVEFREMLGATLSQSGFQNSEIDRYSDFAVATVQDPGPRGPLNLSSKKQIQVAWAPDKEESYRTWGEWVVLDLSRNLLDVDWHAGTTFGANLIQRAQGIAANRRMTIEKIVLGPGAKIEDSQVGNLKELDLNRFWDYSGFATAEVAGKLRGSLPLGRYVHFKQPPNPLSGELEYLTGEMLRVGGDRLSHPPILVHGGPGAGKSTFAAAAIAEANAAGYQVLALHPADPALEACRKDLAGEARVLSMLGSLAYLPPLEASAYAAEQIIDQMVDILLKREDLAGSDAAQSGEWLRSIMKLHWMACGLKKSGAQPRLRGLRTLLADEDQLAEVIRKIEADAELRKDPEARARISWLNSRLATLLLPTKVSWGRRDGSLPFSHFTELMARTIQPFLEDGTAEPAYLERLNDRAQVSLLVRIPANNRLAQPVGAMLIQERLTAVLTARSAAPNGRPLLIVADGTERMPGLDPARLMDQARWANASIILTTRKLRRDTSPGTEFYDGVGAQVFLSPGADEAAQALNAQLGKRSRQIIVRDVRATDGRGLHVTSQADSEYVTQRELRELPGARRPAIVFAPGLGVTAPVLVDEDASAGTLRVGRNGPFKTIADAVRSAPEGARLLIAAGTWVEHVVINRSLEIVADGPPGSVVIESPLGVCLTANSGRVRISGVRFQTEGISVQVWGAALVLESCMLAGHLDATEGELNMRNCEVTDGEVDLGGAKATIEDCRLMSREIDGVLHTGGDAVIRRTCIEAAAKACIEAAGGSLLVEDCDLSQSRYGILANETHVIARRCAIHDIGESPILLVYGGSVDDDRGHEQTVYHA